MAAITVAINGKTLFNWEVDETAIESTLDSFSCCARAGGLSPEALANDLAVGLAHGTVLPDDSVAQKMALVWRILTLDSGHAEHPGKVAAMPTRRRPEFIPECIPVDPNSPDPNVKLPRQAQVAREYAEALSAGRPPRPVAVDVASLTDAQIAAVLERLDRGELNIFDRDPGAVIALIREGARRTKADRQKAQSPKAQAARKAKSAAVTQRLQFVLEAVIALPAKRKQYLTGKLTVQRLARVVGKRLDGPVTEAAIRHDIRELRPVL